MRVILPDGRSVDGTAMRREPADRVSPLMVGILVTVASRGDAGASVREIVDSAGPVGQSRSVTRVSVSRALRRLWRQGAVELHDGRWEGAGRTMSGLQQRAREIAAKAKADPQEFYAGALKVRNYLRRPGDPWGSASACVAAKEREAGDTPKFRAVRVTIADPGRKLLEHPVNSFASVEVNRSTQTRLRDLKP